MVELRTAAVRDAGGLARLHVRAAEHYAAMDPGAFRVPDDAGLEEFLAALLAQVREERLWLVAEVRGELAGSVIAQLREPVPDAGRQVQRQLGERVLHVDALDVAERYRRGGIGRRLMEAAEAWGRERGATRALLDTYARSPLSVPFYEDGLGYSRQAILFEKRL